MFLKKLKPASVDINGIETSTNRSNKTKLKLGIKLKEIAVMVSKDHVNFENNIMNQKNDFKTVYNNKS